MAACRLPAPGTELGPCEKQCTHRDCAATREDAGRRCDRCGKPIGYEIRYYDVSSRAAQAGQRLLAHASCEEDDTPPTIQPDGIVRYPRARPRR